MRMYSSHNFHQFLENQSIIPSTLQLKPLVIFLRYDVNVERIDAEGKYT